MHDPEQRLRQLRRLLLVIELLAPLRRGATVAELQRDISEDIGPVCSRTIRRDLESLELLGLIERARPARWRWVAESIRAAIYHHTATALAECEDP